MERATSKRGFTAVELMIAAVIILGLLGGTVLVVQKDADAMRSIGRIASRETRAQEIISRLERELAFARGARPLAFLQANVGTGPGAVLVDQTAGFPDAGTLLIDRDNGFVERITYDDMDPVTGSFNAVTRGDQCTQVSSHVLGTAVLWSGLAEVIPSVGVPPADQYDGVADERTGPAYFRGDGVGFSFRLPVDPTGANDYFDGATMTWGAEVRGTARSDAWAAVLFQPVDVMTEATLDIDVNLDGDRADTFDVGQLRLRTWSNGDGSVVSGDVGISPPVILQEQCNWGGDLNADGFDDPILLWDPETQRLHVRLLVLVGDVREQQVVRRTESTLYLRNGSDT